jgi:hypothetical protein
LRCGDLRRACAFSLAHDSANPIRQVVLHPTCAVTKKESLSLTYYYIIP